MNCREIVITKLNELGADGLAGDVCGCALDDLGGCMLDCVPAKLVKCADCKKSSDECPYGYVPGDPQGAWCFQPCGMYD